MYRKTIIGAVLFSISMLSIVVLQFWTLGRLHTETAALQRLSKDRLGLSVRINAYQDDGFARTMELVCNANPSERTQLINEIEDLSIQSETAIKTYAESLCEKHQHARFNNLITLRQRYLTIRTQLIELVKQDRQTEALAMAQTALRQSYASYSQAVDELLIADSQSVSHHATRVNQFCSLVVFLVPAIGLLGFLIGFIVPILSSIVLENNSVYEPNLLQIGTTDYPRHPRMRGVVVWILISVIVLIVLGVVVRHILNSSPHC